MKKILLSLLALVSLSVNAQTEFTWTYADWTGVTVEGTNVTGSDEISFSKDGFNLVCKKNDGSSKPIVYYGGSDGTINDLRMYAKATLDVSYTKNITGLEFAVSAQGKKRLATITASTGTVTVDATNWKVFWVGDASSVTFTVGDKATYGTDGATKAGQFDIDNVKLYVDGATPTVTTGKEASGLAYSQGSKTITLGTEYELPTLSNPNNLPVTYTSSKEEVATVDANGTVTVVAAGTCTITAKSEETDKYLEGKASYSLTVNAAAEEGGDDDTPQTEVTIPYEESFAASQGSFVIDNKSLGEGLTYVWKYNSSKYMKASAYASKNIAAESWLVSPTIDLTNATEPILKFTECINKYFGDAATEATVQISEASSNSWSTLSITHPSITSGNWSSFTDQEVNIKDMAGKKVKIAFVYKSTDSAAGTWEVKNFSVTDLTVSGINSVNAETENGSAFNIAGQRVGNNYKGVIIKNGKKFMAK